MKIKKVFYIFILLFITINCFSEENVLVSTFSKGPRDGISWRQRKIQYKMHDTTLSKEKLVSTIWRMDSSVNQFALLIFYTDDVFRIGTYQAGKIIEGKYRIDDGNLILFNYNDADVTGRGRTLKDVECLCKINYSSESILYKHELEINGIKYFPCGSEKQAGEPAKIDDIPVKTVLKKYVFNDYVKFRNAPNLSSDLIDIILYNEMTNGRIKRSSFRKGTVVTVLAEIPQKETISGVTASWCYIKVFSGFEGYQYGWVFGGYFDEYDQNREAEYASQLEKELKFLKN